MRIKKVTSGNVFFFFFHNEVVWIRSLLKIMIEKYLENDERLFETFKYKEKTFIRIKWVALRICGTGKQVLEGISFMRK